MLNKVNKKKYEEIKELDRLQKKLEKWFNIAYLIKKNQNIEYTSGIKYEIKKLIYSCNTISAINLLEENKVKILNGIPNNNHAIEKKTNLIFIDMVKLISKKINDLNNIYMFANSGEVNQTLFTLLEEPKEIEKANINQYKGRMSKIIFNIDISVSILKNKCYLLLFELINKINNYELIDTINDMIEELDEEKLDILYSLLLKTRYIDLPLDDFNKREIFKRFINAVKETTNTKYLKLLIDAIFEEETIKYIDINEYVNILDLLLFIVKQTVGKDYAIGKDFNIELVLKLCKNRNFIFMDDKDLQIKLILSILSLNIKSKFQVESFYRILNSNALYSRNVKKEDKLFVINCLNNLEITDLVKLNELLKIKSKTKQSIKKLVPLKEDKK